MTILIQERRDLLDEVVGWRREVGRETFSKKTLRRDTVLDMAEKILREAARISDVER